MYKCGRVVLSRQSIYFGINKLALQFSYPFHVPYTILSTVYFHNVFSMFPLIFIDSNRKQVLMLYLTVHLCFRKWLNVGQLSVQAGTA